MEARDTLAGLLIVDKPIGPTSMDVCRAVRRKAGQRKLKVGHAGTLDPLASGVLVVAVGKATKTIPKLMATEKHYDAVVDLAAFSPTDDMEGEPNPVRVANPPSRDLVEMAIKRFLGEIKQRPPAFSAVKIGGKRAYQRARMGEPVEPEPRAVVIHEIDLVRFEYPTLHLHVRCGKGVYIRSLARDLGTALGTGGRLQALRRTAVGLFTIDEATPLDLLPDPLAQDHLRSATCENELR